jgi:solute carrier family 25 (mitochondrial carnitine/acylcarnitine transporter), member 20/29
MSSSPKQRKGVGLAGALSGGAQVLAEHPLDTLKVRMQSKNAEFEATRRPPLRLAAHTLRTEGARAFFQGLTPRLLTYSAVKFSLFQLFERAHAETHSTLAAGALAGAANTLVSCPQDALKSRLQVQVVVRAQQQRRRQQRPAYRGPARTARAMLAEGGAGAFYRGWRPLLLRDTVGYGVLYSIYLHGKESGPAWVPAWAWGGLSGLGFYLSTLPVDRVKTVMMTQPPGKPLYRSATAAFRDIAAVEGAMGLYRGCAPTLARTFLGQAVALSVFDAVMTSLNSGGAGAESQ